MSGKRILIVGSNQVWSLERIYFKHLQSLGHEMELFAAQDQFYSYYGKGFINKLIFRSGLSNIYRGINEELIKKVNEFNPELIWVFKGMELLPSTLKQIKVHGAILVNYNPDNPFLFSGRGSGNINITRSMDSYHAHFTYDRNIQQTIIKKYKLPCYLLPFGFELSSELYYDCTQQEEVLKLCFIGNPDAERIKILEQLAEFLPLDVYGNHWEKYTTNKNITSNPPVYGVEFWKTLYRYRVQLNLMRPHNPNSHNMRSFEVPAVGGIGLFPDTIDHKEYFYNAGMVYLFSNTKSCIYEATSILNLAPDKAKEKRIHAHKASWEKEYDYLDRTKQFLNSIDEL